MNADVASHHPSELPPGSIDLRSDTVTRPTAEMYEQMARAPLGDDGLDHDPTVRELEETLAQRLGKEAAVFVPTCTMSNMIAVLSQVPRQCQVIFESSAHMCNTERGAMAITGTFPLIVPGKGGLMDLDILRQSLIAGPRYRMHTGLVCMETTHNGAGGVALPLDYMAAVSGLAHEHGASVHIDGARLFNAAAALKVDVKEITQYTDTVSVCLSKGLSAPMGAVFCGPTSVIKYARELRAMMGGTLRQTGVVAAAGLVGVRSMTERLADDHAVAALFAQSLNAEGCLVTASDPQTNIVQLDVSATGHDSAWWTDTLEEAGVRVRPLGQSRLRAVTHRHIDQNDAVEAARIIGEVARRAA